MEPSNGYQRLLDFISEIQLSRAESLGMEISFNGIRGAIYSSVGLHFC